MGQRWIPRIAGGADDGDGDNGSGDGGDGDTGQGDGGEGEGAGGENDASKLTLSQADLDALINKRLGQAKKAWENDAKTAADRAKLDETERLKAEKADTERAAEERAKIADQRIIRAEAKVQAVDAGVKPARAAAFLRVLDLDDVELDDNGDVDADALKKAIEATLKDFPEFKAAAGSGGASGGEHPGGPPQKPKNLSAAVANHYAN